MRLLTSRPCAFSPHLSVQCRHDHSPANLPVLAICWDEALAHHEVQDLREDALWGEEARG